MYEDTDWLPVCLSTKEIDNLGYIVLQYMFREESYHLVFLSISPLQIVIIRPRERATTGCGELQFVFIKLNRLLRSKVQFIINF